MGRFTGKTVLVTGGGSGMGEAFSRRFAAEGASVAILDLDADAARRVADAITAEAGQAAGFQADVADAGSMVEAVGQCVGRFGRLDIAINNAGIAGARHRIPDLPLDAWNRSLAVNLTGVFHSLRAELPAIAASGGGAIVNISSITGVIAHPMAAPYVATKHAVIGLTKSAALEWGADGIRVNAVAPTWVHTPMTEAVFDAARWAELGARHAIGRCVTMAEVAAVVTFLASDEASAVTGSVYLADGGYTAA